MPSTENNNTPAATGNKTGAIHTADVLSPMDDGSKRKEIMKATPSKTSSQYGNSPAVDLNAVLEHQHQIEAAQQMIDTLSSAISVQDKALAEAQADIPQFSYRASQRENLMAEIALGESSEDALLKLDERIAKDRKAFEKAKITAMPLIDKAQTIRAGLERKLMEAKAEAQCLESSSQKIKQLFLIQEAEKTAVEYIAHAQDIKMNYLRLRALEILIKSQGGKSINGFSSAKLFIPTFALPQFDGLENRNAVEHGTLYSGYWDGLINTFTQLAEYEKERLEGLGIQF